MEVVVHHKPTQLEVAEAVPLLLEQLEDQAQMVVLEELVLQVQ